MSLNAVAFQLDQALELPMLFARSSSRFSHRQSAMESLKGGSAEIRQNPGSLSVDKHVRSNYRHPATKRAHSRLGAATVELALVAPFILFIIFGSVEFARMMMVKQTLTNAAREGCRHATLATSRDHESAETVVRALLKGTVADGQDPGMVRVTITPSFQSSPVSGTEIQALVEVDCADVSWLPATLFAGAKVRGVACMNRE